LQLGWSGAIDRHSLQLNTRHDRYSTSSQHKTTGNVAYGYRLTDEWRLHGGYGTAFRLPTFNQLFFPGFGNPDLAPESSRNKEAGVVWQRKGSRAAL
ncbi:TonB-dependent receptor, partial [Salmonella enterica subsp. enterica serovar Typhimurium]|nr:TonB-dependent receptor [Salmonella enterica subsp. enterica serovar Typhimurium]